MFTDSAGQQSSQRSTETGGPRRKAGEEVSEFRQLFLGEEAAEDFFSELVLVGSELEGRSGPSRAQCLGALEGRLRALQVQCYDVVLPVEVLERVAAALRSLSTCLCSDAEVYSARAAARERFEARSRRRVEQMGGFS